MKNDYRIKTDIPRNAKIKGGGGQLEVFTILNGYENIDSGLSSN